MEYWIDAWQRAVLFWDVVRERGNRYLEHERSGKPPVLAFEYEMVLDTRATSRRCSFRRFCAVLLSLAPSSPQ
jgi:hypothetical protein